MLAVQKIDQAMIVFGDENGYAWAIGRGGNAPLNRKLLCDGRKALRKLFQIELEGGEIPFDAREVETLFTGLMLLEMEDVTTMPVDEIRNGGIEAAAIRAAKQEDSAIHGIGPFAVAGDCTFVDEGLSRRSVGGPTRMLRERTDRRYRVEDI